MSDLAITQPGRGPHKAAGHGAGTWWEVARSPLFGVEPEGRGDRLVGQASPVQLRELRMLIEDGDHRGWTGRHLPLHLLLLVTAR
ncbi:MAG: hypothetical protein ACRDKA_13155, partial [Actinomycetota bacterium]